MQVVDLLDVVVVEVEEDEVRQGHQVLYPCDQVVLQVEEAKTFLALEEGHVGELALIKLEAFGVGGPLARLAIDDEHARNLRQLSEDDLVLILNTPHNTIGEQVAIALVILALMQSYT